MSERKLMTIAAITSCLLHIVAALLTWNLPLMAEAEDWTPVPDDNELELTLLPDQDATTESDLPTSYVAIPERLAAETPPTDPDFLALHNARAADLKPGGEDLHNPTVDQESEVTQVAIRREELSGAEGVEYSPTFPMPSEQREQSRAGQRQDSESEAEPAQDGRQPDAAGQWVLDEGDAAPEEQEPAGDPESQQPEGTDSPDWIAGQPPTILKQGREGQDGDRGFDFQHNASGKVSGNVAVTGAFSLNTYEWNYAPWMHRFEKDLRRHWMAPYAYMLGVISGVTRIRIVVERSGKLSSLEVIDSEGHESLHHASEAALRAFAPYAPLPPGFPDENLVIVYSLYYPAWRR